LHYSGLMVGRTKAQAQALLKQYAEADMQKFKYTGFRGAFTAFGAPSVAHGQIVDLQDADFADRNGSFYIDGVRKTFGQEGYRQEITIGAKWKI